MITGHGVVDAIGQMRFEGNILPHSWFQCPELRFASGKPNTVAILLLADIIYWYRPNIQMSEATGQIASVTKRFRADMLHKDYALWAVKFGFTKRQVQDAVKFLRDKGIVRTELRDVVTSTGARIYNATFIEPVPVVIHRITFQMDFAASSSVTTLSAGVTPPPFQRDTSPVETGDLLRSGVGDVTLKRNSCTETTYENKEKKKSELKNFSAATADPKLEEVAKQIFCQQPASLQEAIEREGRDIVKYVQVYLVNELAAAMREE